MLFISGVVVSAIASNLLEKVITWSEGILAFSSVVLVISAIYFFSTVSEHMQTLSNKMATTVSYKEELFREHEGVAFRGVVFRELAKLVSEAESEILALAATVESVTELAQPTLFKTTEHPSRAEYLRALEDTIVRHREIGFKYVRINQVPLDGIDKPLSKYLGNTSSAHCRRILELERQSDNAKLTLAIMKLPQRRLGSFMIVDRRYLVLEVDGIDSEGNPYAAGMFFLEDREGRIIERFLWYFDNLERLAQPVTLEEL
ncbi:MAG: hypothetical protein D6694_13050 [Gammaproteobacteria bacterium]|nr:MAG: hypothetical protein D6694_13050 [Gammaproteobacteria bacterium]